MALVSKKGKKFLEQWSEGSLDLVGFFHGFVLQVSGFSHVWWLKFHAFSRHSSSRVSFFTQLAISQKQGNVSDSCMFFLSNWIETGSQVVVGNTYTEVCFLISLFCLKTGEKSLWCCLFFQIAVWLNKINKIVWTEYFYKEGWLAVVNRVA